MGRLHNNYCDGQTGLKVGRLLGSNRQQILLKKSETKERNQNYLPLPIHPLSSPGAAQGNGVCGQCVALHLHCSLSVPPTGCCPS